jgi:hypothetical protein
MAVVIIVNPNMITSIPNQKYVIFMYKKSKSLVLCTQQSFFYGFHHKLQFSSYLDLESQKEDGKRDFVSFYNTLSILICFHIILYVIGNYQMHENNHDLST